jgi:hypothetical protein
MPIAITIIVLLVIGAIVGATLNFAGIWLGIPFVLIFIGVVIGKEGLDRQRRIWQMKRFRDSARARKIEFTETDKRTVI